MKIGINLAAEILRSNIEQEIVQSGCPAIIVRAILEQQLEASKVRYNAAVHNEQQMYQEEQKKVKGGEGDATGEEQGLEQKGEAVND